MTSVLKKTAAQQRVEEEAAMNKMNSKTDKVLKEVQGVNDILSYVGERFNSLREQLAICAQLMKYSKNDSYKYVILAKSLACGDYGLVLDENPDTSTYDVEDAGEFARLIEAIENTRRYDTRMNMCISVAERIKEAMDRWQSKISKMNINTKRGSTPAEIKVAEKKRIQFEEAVQILIKRRKMVFSIFLNAKKQVNEFLTKTNEKFMQTMD